MLPKGNCLYPRCTCNKGGVSHAASQSASKQTLSASSTGGEGQSPSLFALPLFSFCSRMSRYYLFLPLLSSLLHTRTEDPCSQRLALASISAPWWKLSVQSNCSINSACQKKPPKTITRTCVAGLASLRQSLGRWFNLKVLLLCLTFKPCIVPYLPPAEDGSVQIMFMHDLQEV